VSPTQLTLKQLRAEGYTARVVERWNQYARIRQDCFGFDVLAAREETFGRAGCGDVVGIQACAAASHSARVAKLLANPEARVFIASRKARIEVWSWSTRRSEERTKAGKRSKRLVHHLRREEIRLSDFVPQQAFSEGRGGEQPREANSIADVARCVAC
jgi:hypothetical protein